MNISFYETKPWEERYLKSRLKDHRLKFIRAPFTRGEASVDYLSVFIYSRVTGAAIGKMPNLRQIATRSTGYDHIDIEACMKRGIVVSNVPSYGENTVAEHTFALILSLSRNIHKSYLRTQCDDFSIEGLEGFDLKGKTLGIIGGGHIGMHVARMAKGFGMEVLVYDLNRQGFLSEVLGFAYEGIDRLLRRSDIVSVHLPYNRFTHHLIDKKRLGMMKSSALLINTSRGGIVDTNSLLVALKRGWIRGAGLDVIEGEEFIKGEILDKDREKWKEFIRDHKILHMDNVVFTPHNAFNSEEARQRILDTTIANIKSAIKGRPVNTVDGRGG